MRWGETAASPPILPFVLQTVDALPVDLQRLDVVHVLRRMGLHGHTFFALIVVEQAGGSYRLGGGVHPADPGQPFLVPPGKLQDCSRLRAAAKGWVLLFTYASIVAHEVAGWDCDTQALGIPP